jgi:predicted DNA-binding transcriptional regulator AlpA
MRSESLRRLDKSDQASPSYRMNPARADIARQTEEFLAGGGRIQRIPTTLGTQPRLGLNGEPIRDYITGQIASLPPREMVDGRALITIQRVMNMVGMSSTTIRKRMEQGLFPEPFSRKVQLRWDERDILEWLEKNG